MGFTKMVSLEKCTLGKVIENTVYRMEKTIMYLWMVIFLHYLQVLVASNCDQEPNFGTYNSTTKLWKRPCVRRKIFYSKKAYPYVDFILEKEDIECVKQHLK